MKVSHFFGKEELAKEVDGDCGFLLTNKKGGYLSFFNYPGSRYQGWFLAFGDKLFRIIENMEIKDAARIEELRNGFWRAERKIVLAPGERVLESFFLPAFSNSLVWQASKIVPLEIVLDTKESFDNQEIPRQYEMFEEQGIIIVKFSQADKFFYLAAKPENMDYSKPGVWFERFYKLDKERNSPPFTRTVYKALELRSKKIVFSVSDNKNEAKNEAMAVFKKIRIFEEDLDKRSAKLLFCKKVNNRSPEIRMAYRCAKNSLADLLVLRDKEPGLYAGLPWFFQFWARDQAVCLKTLWALDRSSAKKIFFRLLKSIKQDGEIENIPFGAKFPLSPSSSADGAGWLFKRAEALMREKQFTLKEKKDITGSLSKTIDGLLKEHTEEDFAICQPFGTWMDTVKRDGPRIEIQAFRLALYRLAYSLLRDKKYRLLERDLKKKTRQRFWNGEIVTDGSEDSTLRPNIFLAAYIYPNLLSKKVWLECFEKSLTKLWLDWGGVTTIDKSLPMFVPRASGEDTKSYHQGDSWFYLNNLTALVLFRFAGKKFESYIKKILEASTNEILWQGLVGHHAELSSASNLTSEGCRAQAWSNALYLEAIEGITMFKTRL